MVAHLYKLIRPLLFLLDAEISHDLVFGLARLLYLVPGTRVLVRLLLAKITPRLSVEVMGLQFANPIGLAAGLDKNARNVRILSDLGFGWLELGTVTPRPQAGNPRPRFVFPAVRVVKADIVGTDHVRCLLAPSSGGERLSAMAFRCADSELGRALLGTGGTAIHVAGYLEINTWRGSRTARLVVEDAARVR